MFWRLHKAIFQDRIDEVTAILDKFQDTYQIVEGKPSQLAPVNQSNLNQASLAMTTLQDARRLLRQDYPSTPWLFYHEEHYDVSYWSSHLDSNISWINRKGIFLPYHLALTMSEELKDYLTGEDNKIFIRPDSGNKLFTGFSIENNSEFKKNIETTLLVNRQEPSTLCLVAPHKNIQSTEWRFWISERQIIAHTPYSWEEEPTLRDAPELILEEVEKLIKMPWQPDYTYVADFCLDKENMAYLIEINATSTSGIYQANLQNLISGLRKTAIEEYDGLLD